VTVRDATPDDLDLLMSLVERLESELPPPPYADHSPEVERGKVERVIADGLALLAEEEGRPVAYALARYGEHGPTTVYVSDLWVDASARRRGLARELLRRISETAAARGCTHVLLDVDSRNHEAAGFYEHLGFEEEARTLQAPVEALLAAGGEARPSVGTVHVQSDDAEAVERVVDDYLPRLVRDASAAVDRGREWTAVRVEPYDRDVLRKLGAELSYRFGVTVVLSLEEESVVHFVIHDRGSMVDEYLSVPEYFGPLPPGDALAMRANPTVVARLTGAEPASVRAVARTATSAGELPPPRELYVQIAEVMGLRP
jgi:ribosomal protein S18 acetylase RimI-like enzyme